MRTVFRRPTAVAQDTADCDLPPLIYEVLEALGVVLPTFETEGHAGTPRMVQQVIGGTLHHDRAFEEVVHLWIIDVADATSKAYLVEAHLFRDSLQRLVWYDIHFAVVPIGVKAPVDQDLRSFRKGTKRFTRRHAWHQIQRHDAPLLIHEGNSDLQDAEAVSSGCFPAEFGGDHDEIHGVIRGLGR